MAEVLTPMRRQILEYIRECQTERSFPPTIREIADHVGLSSPATVANHINVLRDAGYIEKNPQQPRTLTVRLEPEAPRDARTRLVPLVGDVAAGTGVLADETTHELLALPEQLVGARRLLRAAGARRLDGRRRDPLGRLRRGRAPQRVPQGRDRRRRDPRRGGDRQALLPQGRRRRARAGQQGDGAARVRRPRGRRIYGKVVSVLRRSRPATPREQPRRSRSSSASVDPLLDGGARAPGRRRRSSSPGPRARRTSRRRSSRALARTAPPAAATRRARCASPSAGGAGGAASTTSSESPSPIRSPR